jgi:hypothetical protein
MGEFDITFLSIKIDKVYVLVTNVDLLIFRMNHAEFWEVTSRVRKINIFNQRIIAHLS